ncbi:hypothetical protein [Streptomyces albidoflavus]|uniref:hypothetical protein n=1 Tax=Streptomyces albidoflavus TaxID=1886 RepID=UPI0021B0A727|nr:hypothetical protein [Streptomyces albidoflavus]
MSEPAEDFVDAGYGTIDVVGARSNNLRNVSLSIPKGRLVAFTGVSGSGKTSLAVDTLHSEAQLRYLEGLSPFVRQYITQRNRPKVDRLRGLGATLAVDQRRTNRNPRSTVATISGIDGYLGLLFSRLPALGVESEVKGTAAHLNSAHFDRKTPEGGCCDCHGAGGSWQPHEKLIIPHPELPLFEGASPWFAKWRSGEHAFVPALARKRGVDLALPWKALPEEFRHCVLHGRRRAGRGDHRHAEQERDGTHDLHLEPAAARSSRRGTPGVHQRPDPGRQGALPAVSARTALPNLRRQRFRRDGTPRATRRKDVSRPARGGGSGGADLGRAPEERTRSRAARRG